MPTTNKDRKVLSAAAMDLLRTLYRAEKANGTYEQATFLPVHLEQIASQLGWRVQQVSGLGSTAFGEAVAGKCDFETRIIYVNKDLPADGERRFTLAHEIGHVVLNHRNKSCSSGALYHHTKHRGSARSILAPIIVNDDPSTDAMEIEAQAFAAELLMPEPAVRKYFRENFKADLVSASSHFVERILQVNHKPKFEVAFELGTYKPSKNMPSLAERFGVSRAAMGKRLQELQLVID